MFGIKPATVEIPISTLSFKDIIRRSIVNVWKLVDVLKFHLIYYKIITGKGLEFDRLREYVEGDDATRIDWNSFARTTKPFVKIFKEERMLDVIFVVDVSNTMIVGTTELIKNEYASVLTTTLAYASYIIGDKVGMVCFADKVKLIIEPSLTMDNVLEMARVLSKKEIYGGKKNWDSLHGTVLETFTPDTFVILISDFIGTKDSALDFITKCRNRYKGVLAIMLRDPIDSYLPKGIGYMYIADPDTGRVSLVNVDKIRDAYNRKVELEEKHIERKLAANGVDFVKVHTSESFVKPIIRLLKKKEVMEWS